MNYLVLLIAYSMSEVSIVAPLSSLVIFSNIAVGYVWLKEKDNLLKKITAAILAVVGIVLISL